MNTTCIVFLVNQLSILSVIDENGTKVFDASYDAWGKQTVTLNTMGLLRGYTGHEMLNEFNLINMNGRVYDPVLGRFLSPDKYVQEADNSQNYNSYSYCLNNPLKYTDPSGNLFGISYTYRYKLNVFH
ncbi:MAG: RHS repeat-associated core domain-containing protein [Prevotella sp.]|nr:RHS repeat-associated core domain-containing protein [Prevotella sp.]